MKYFKKILELYTSMSSVVIVIFIMVVLGHYFFGDVNTFFENLSFNDVKSIIGVYFFSSLTISIFLIPEI